MRKRGNNLHTSHHQLFEKKWDSWPLCRGKSRILSYSIRPRFGIKIYGHGSETRHLPTKLGIFLLLALSDTGSGILEVKFPTIWTNEKAEVKQSEKRREEKTRSNEGKGQKKQDQGASRKTLCFLHCFGAEEVRRK